MAASSIYVELYTAIDARLTGDATFMSLITGLFIQPPVAQAFPYVTMGNSTRGPWKQFQKPGGTSILMPFDIWTDVHDGDTALLILAELDRLLDDQPLPLVNYTNVQLFNELTVDVPEEAQELRHITARYRANSEQN